MIKIMTLSYKLNVLVLIQGHIRYMSSFWGQWGIEIGMAQNTQGLMS